MNPRILVPVDGSQASRHGLAEAIAIAGALKSTLVLLHVIDDTPLMVAMASAVQIQESLDLQHEAAAALLAQAAASAEQAGVESRRVLREVSGMPVADVVVEVAREHACGLIVMGTHGRRGLSRLTLGSDAELVVRQAEVPVMLVRAQQTSPS
jgi:nucleotide-binding universal stress UspA family protein